MTTLSTAQQELETLEQMSKEVCPACNEDGVWNPVLMLCCPDCNGSGLKWEGLSREEGCHHTVAGIPNDDPEWGYNDPDFEEGFDAEDGYSSCNCQGSGRVPVSVAEAVLWIITWVIAKDGEVFIQSRTTGIFCQIRWPSNQMTIPSGATDWFVATKETPALALFAAMQEVK